MLEVTFVQRHGRRDRVHVTRDDGTSTGWDFPSYGDGFPHDLCHLVVEDELRLTDGFWGLVEQGVDVEMVDSQATLVRGGKPPVGAAGAGFSGLNEAEAAVAMLAGPEVTVHAVGDVAVASLTPSQDVRAPRKGMADALGVELPASANPGVLAAVSSGIRLDLYSGADEAGCRSESIEV